MRLATLPEPVRLGIEDALGRLGLGTQVVGARPVAGGCINHGAKLDTDTGASFFLKWNAVAPPGMFEAEADGLTALGKPNVLRVPRPFARGGGSGTPAWLVMEYVEAGTPKPHFNEALGQGLARLHRRGTAGEESFGWDHDNWIGSLDQCNGRCDSWSDFWRERRILPQLQAARRAGYMKGDGGELLERVVELIPAGLADVDEGPPSLLHGDLWGGNAYADHRGEPVIIDPSTYLGHGEVDLAMTELFGGFGPRFYEAYHEVTPITDAYHAYRKSLYQLYYLLVHVNLFGGAYEARSLEAARTVVSELG